MRTVNACSTLPDSPTRRAHWHSSIAWARRSITSSSLLPTKRARRSSSTSSTNTDPRGAKMATTSPIEWTDVTWNPVTGCSKISPGCKFCYAERLALRLQAMGQKNYRNGFEVTVQPHMLEHPLRWRQPRRVFVNSMSDLFHAQAPVPYIPRGFDIMRRAWWHPFQVLTKRSE